MPFEPYSEAELRTASAEAKKIQHTGIRRLVEELIASCLHYLGIVNKKQRQNLDAQKRRYRKLREEADEKGMTVAELVRRKKGGNGR